MRSYVLLILSVMFVGAGLVILNGACAFAMLSAPPEDQVAVYRQMFYQRAGLGIGCILVGIVLLRLRRKGGA